MKRIMSTSALTILLASGATAQQSTQSGQIFANVPNDPSLVLGTEYIGQNIYSTLSAANGMPADQSATTGQATTEQATGELATTEEPTATGQATTTGEAGTTEQQTAVGQQPQSVGQISDVIMTQDGQVEYVILGVGGFLGIGEQNVAVDFDALSMQPDPQNEGEMMIMISATQEQIENAPEFDPALIEGTGENMQGGQTGTVNTESNAQVETTESDAQAETTQSTETQSGGEMETIEADSSNTTEVENSAENAAAETEQTVEGAANETEQAAEDAGQAVGNAADEAASETGEAVEQTGDAVENATDEATSSN